MQASLPARPTVSFVLATHNRGAVLVDCVRKIIAAARPVLGAGRFFVSIVDNASTDGTGRMIERLAAVENCVRLISLPENCGPVAKNMALAGNPADIIVLMDDDAYPLPGALAQMVRHFQDDPHLGAAVFDVTLPDGAKEASAYPDVFIGAGTAIRGAALRELTKGAGIAGGGLLPADFFMQAEEYDLSFRLLGAGWSVQRFWDMPLMHLKTPGARIGSRTTRLDVRNNLWLLARYLPEPLCHEFAADWMARYWQMAVKRGHKPAFVRGAAEGLRHWGKQRGTGDLVLNAETVERIFKFEAIERRLGRAKQQHGLSRIAFGDWGKNMLAFWRAAGRLEMQVAGVVDGRLEGAGVEYRGVPVIGESGFDAGAVDAIVITAISRPHAQRRAAELRRIFRAPVIDLFDPVSVGSAALKPAFSAI